MPNLLRLRAYRSDPDGGLLGPLKATHFGFGDVAGLDSGLTGTANSGRGAVVTNRPLVAPSAFDRTRFEGDLPSGWDAEIYRNGELLAFAKPDAGQRYVFDDVQLLYGENRPLDRPLWSAGADPDPRRADQRRAGPCAGRQDLVLGRRQPAGARTRVARAPARRAGPRPQPGRGHRSNMGSTSARRSAPWRA